jgi:hypothetical protein
MLLNPSSCCRQPDDTPWFVTFLSHILVLEPLGRKSQLIFSHRPASLIAAFVPNGSGRQSANNLFKFDVTKKRAEKTNQNPLFGFNLRFIMVKNLKIGSTMRRRGHCGQSDPPPTLLGVRAIPGPRPTLHFSGAAERLRVVSSRPCRNRFPLASLNKYIHRLICHPIPVPEGTPPPPLHHHHPTHDPRIYQRSSKGCIGGGRTSCILEPTKAKAKRDRRSNIPE